MFHFQCFHSLLVGYCLKRFLLPPRLESHRRLTHILTTANKEMHDSVAAIIPAGTIGLHCWGLKNKLESCFGRRGEGDKKSKQSPAVRHSLKMCSQFSTYAASGWWSPEVIRARHTLPHYLLQTGWHWHMSNTHTHTQSSEESAYQNSLEQLRPKGYWTGNLAVRVCVYTCSVYYSRVVMESPWKICILMEKTMKF